MSDIEAARSMMRRLATARVAGDVTTLADLFAEDASFEIVGFGARVVGRQRIHAGLAALIADFQFVEWEPLAIVAHGNTIASRHRLKVCHVPNGKVVESETAEFLTMDGELCTSFTQFADTALITSLMAS